MCRIALLDKNEKVLETLKAQINKINLQLVCASHCIQETIAFLNLNQVDVLVVATSFEMELKNELISKFQKLKIIQYDSLVNELDSTNLNRITTKSNAIEIIFQEIRLVYRMSLENIQKKIPKVKLTQREIEVLKLIAFGYKIKEIANRLGISYYTAENHKKNLLTKMKVKNIASLVHIGHKLNYLD